MIFSKVSIGEVVSLRQGFAINKNTKHHMSNEPTDLHLLRIGDMKDGSYSIYVKDTIPAHFIANEDDIIYTRTGQVGLVFRKQHGVIHNNCFSVTPQNEDVLDRGFLFYVLQTKEFYEEANSKASGAAQPDLPHGAFNSISIPIPDIDIQRKISNILESYDDLIENNQKQIKLLEEAAQRLYKEWFVDLRFPGHENIEIVDGVPDGWKKGNVGHLFKTVLGGTPSRNIADYWGGDIPWINSGEVNKLRIIKESEFITGRGLNNSSTKLMPKHTTVLAITGATLGQVSYTEIETCANQSVVGVYDETGEYSAYIYLCITNEIKKIISEAIGGAQQHINKEVVNKFELLLPSFDVNERMKAIVVPMFDKITNLYFEIERLSEARDRLLPKLMSGEIEV